MHFLNLKMGAIVGRIMTKKLVSSQNEVDPQYSPIRRIIFRQNEVDPQYSPIRNFFYVKMKLIRNTQKQE